MNYKLINKTNISTKKIREFINFTSPKGLDGFTISILIPKGDIVVEGVTEINKKYSRIWLADVMENDSEYPRLAYHKPLKRVGYSPNILIQNFDELLLSMLAHELRHLWQGTVSKQKFHDGKLCKYVHWDGKTYMAIYRMERDACKYTKKMLDKFRRKL